MDVQDRDAERRKESEEEDENECEKCPVEGESHVRRFVRPAIL